jgi:hypothetical protein
MQVEFEDFHTPMRVVVHGEANSRTGFGLELGYMLNAVKPKYIWNPTTQQAELIRDDTYSH